MTSERTEFPITHTPEEQRYVMTDPAVDEVIGEEEYVDVTVGDKVHRVMHHTRVADEYGGRGLASQLVRFAVEDTVARGLRVVGVCPYVDRWLEKHPEFKQHEVKARPEHLAALRK